MFKLLDEREHFYQWDLNQKLIVEDSTVTEVHFCNKLDNCSLVCEVYEENGLRLVNVPNILLQTAWDIRVYAYCATGYTKAAERIRVVERSKPADYVYTETEVKSYEALEKRIEELEINGGGGTSGQVKIADVTESEYEKEIDFNKQFKTILKNSKGTLSIEASTVNFETDNNIYFNNKLCGLKEPEYEDEAATKGYVDREITLHGGGVNPEQLEAAVAEAVGDIDRVLEHILELQQELLGEAV